MRPVASADSAALLAATDTLRPLIEAHRDQAEHERQYPADVIAAMAATGVMSMAVPAQYGGIEAPAPVILDVLQRLAHADAAAGWLAMIGTTTSSLAGRLPEAGARQVFADPRAVTAGAFAPTATGAVEGDGLRVNGRWQWGSGTNRAAWITGGVMVTSKGDTPPRQRLVFMSADQVTLHDTWFTAGLRATRSGDFSIDDGFIPTSLTFDPLTDRPAVDCPLTRFPNFTFLASCVAATVLGIAQRALDEIVVLASEKRPVMSKRTVAQHALSLIELPRAQARWAAARSLLHDEVGGVWEAVVAGERVDVHRRARVRLACIHAAEASLAATQTAFTLGGGTAVFAESPLQRCLRDVETACQHVMVTPRVYEVLGKVLTGLDADTTTL